MNSHLQMLQRWDRALQADPHNPQIYVRRGMTHFKLGQITESIQDFDRAEQLDPQLTPYLWQRGLSYYYADRFAEGIQQFETDLTVNGQDVEETVWRYLCMAQLQDAATARNGLLPVRNDPRPIMRSVYDLFAETLTPTEVIEIGSHTGSHGKFYSLLYAGLYYEATRDTEQAKLCIEQAVQVVQTQYRTEDYMGYLAIVHQQVRQWGSIP